MKNAPRLKVALVFDDTLDSDDGVAQYVKTLGSWLSAQGHEVSYLVGETKISDWHGGRVYSLSTNIKVRFNGNRLSIPLPANRRRIKRLLGEKKFDVIHVMVRYSPFMAARVIKAAEANAVVVGTFHIFPSGRLSVLGSRLLRIWLRGTLSKFDEIVSVSSAASGFARSAYHIDSDIVPNAVDIKRFEQNPPVPISKNQIFFLGRLVKRKGAEQLIRAFSKLAQSNANVELVIAGDGPQRPALEALAKKLGIGNKVSFLGYIKEENKPRLLAAANIACFPSLYGESFGIVLVEAMAAGAKVVLAGDNPGYSSVLGDQPQLLVDPLDTERFAKRLQELLTDEKQADSLNHWQLETVAQYDIDTVGQKLVSIYTGQIARAVKKSNNKAHG